MVVSFNLYVRTKALNTHYRYMRAEHLFRPTMPIMKPLACSFVLLLSLLQSPSSLKAAEPTAEIPETCVPVTAISMQEEPSASTAKNFFTDLKKYFGIRYRFGGDSPAGFDCSGFVRFMFSKELNIDLPHSSRAMSAMGIQIDRSELRPGDLVFFKNSGDRINHVGIFIGNDTFIHASLSRGIALDRLSSGYFLKRYATAVRIVELPESQHPQNVDLHSDAIEETGSPS